MISLIWNKTKNYSYSDISSNRISTKFMRLKTLSLNEIVQTEGFEFFHNTLTLILCFLVVFWCLFHPWDFHSGWFTFELISQNVFLYNRIKIKNCSLHITGSFIYLVNIKTQILSDKTSLIVKTPTNREVTDLICHQPSLSSSTCHQPSRRIGSGLWNENFIKYKITWLSHWRKLYLLNC